MDSEEKSREPEDFNAVKKSKRLRSTAKSTSICPVETDKDALSSLSNESEYEYSEDEWDVSGEKRTRAKKPVPIPKQTLKLKLLEKTRKLRQLGKQSTVVAVAQRPTQADVSETSTDDKDGKKVGCSASASASAAVSEPESNNNQIAVETSTEDSKPPLDKLAEYQTYSRNDAKAKNVEYQSATVAACASIKNETLEDKTKIQETVKKECDREPMVIEYSINRCQISSALSPCYSPSTSTSQTNRSSISTSSQSASANDVRVPFTKLNDAVVDRTNRCKNEDHSRSQLASNLNARSCTRTRSESDAPSLSVAQKRRKVSKAKKNNCVSYPSQPQPTLDVGSQRIPSATATRPINSVRVVKNFKNNHSPISATRKMNTLSSDQIRRSSSSSALGKISSKRTGPLTTTKTSDYVFNKFGNISPNGTVIHTGTGSVTITPRKPWPEKPPTQRKLFKNEIEGTIAVRSIESSLRYVVNLANGTYIVLSDLQVAKLREQHKGALPTKLKIPVPCDVADKIEPSFLIED